MAFKTVQKSHLIAAAAVTCFLVSTSVAFQVGPRVSSRSLQGLATTWNKDENLSFALSWRRSESHYGNHIGKSMSQQRRLHDNNHLPCKATSLTMSLLSSKKGTSSEAPSTAELSAELSGAMVRLLAQFVTTELKPVIEQAKHKQLVQEASRQVEQLEATVHESQEAQEKVLPTWTAAGKAIQETSNSNSNYTANKYQDDDINISNNNNRNSQEESQVVESVASSFPTASTISAPSSGLGLHSELSHPHRDDVNTTRSVALFDHFDTDDTTPEIVTEIPATVRDESELIDVAATELSLTPSPSESFKVSSLAEDAAVTTTLRDDSESSLPEAAASLEQDPLRSVLPRIPPVISLQFGKPLPVVVGDASAEASGSWQQGSNAAPVDGMGSTAVTPPSMSLSSSAMNDSQSTLTDDATDVIELNHDESPSMVAADGIGSQEQEHQATTEHGVESDIVDGRVEEESSVPVHVEAVPPVAAALSEEQLAAKYASILTLEERAFTILLDLGMIQRSPDPDDPNYDHSHDDELCAENVWIQPPP